MFCVVVACDLKIRKCNFFFISVVIDCFYDKTCKVKILVKIEICLIVSGKFQFYYIRLGNVFCSCQFFCISAKWIVCTMVFVCVDIFCSTLCFVSFTIGINNIYPADSFCCAAVCGIMVMGYIIMYIKALIVTDYTAYISSFCCFYSSVKSIALEIIGVPCLCNEAVTAKDSADFIFTDDCSCGNTVVNCNTDSVWCSTVCVTTACNTAGMITACLYCSVESTACYSAVTHCIVTASNDTAYITGTINSCMADTVFYSSLHTSCEAADYVLVFVVTNDNTGLNSTVLNCSYETGRASCKSVCCNVCSKETGF